MEVDIWHDSVWLSFHYRHVPFSFESSPTVAEIFEWNSSKKGWNYKGLRWSIPLWDTSCTLLLREIAETIWMRIWHIQQRVSGLPFQDRSRFHQARLTWAETPEPSGMHARAGASSRKLMHDPNVSMHRTHSTNRRCKRLTESSLPNHRSSKNNVRKELWSIIQKDEISHGVS